MPCKARRRESAKETNITYLNRRSNSLSRAPSVAFSDSSLSEGAKSRGGPWPSEKSKNKYKLKGALRSATQSSHLQTNNFLQAKSNSGRTAMRFLPLNRIEVQRILRRQATKNPNGSIHSDFFGAPRRIRTCDLPVRSRALYPLS